MNCFGFVFHGNHLGWKSNIIRLYRIIGMLNFVSSWFGWPTANEASTQELDAAKSTTGQDESDQQKVMSQGFTVLLLSESGEAYICWPLSIGTFFSFSVVLMFFVHAQVTCLYILWFGCGRVKLEGWCALAKGVFFGCACEGWSRHR